MPISGNSERRAEKVGCVSSPASMAARMVRAQFFVDLPSIRVCRCRRTSSARLLSMMKFWNALKVFRGAADFSATFATFATIIFERGRVAYHYIINNYMS